MATTSAPAPTTAVDAPAAGLDPSRLARVRDHLESRYIETGKLAGCQVLVWRRGHTAYFESLGAMELGGTQPVRDDAIWRIYSMTKPITSVALMTLYERGLFQLKDPVERFIPSWQGLKVYGQSQPAQPMSVRDLLMHTSGLTSTMSADNPVGRLYVEAGLARRDYDLAEFARRLAELPLLFEPGSRWHYSAATDVCGYLVEVLSGRPFEEYLRTELFEPLGMADTAFQVPAPARDRVPAIYRRTEDKTLTPVPGRDLTEAPVFKSGAGGLLSTTSDYLRFGRMLLNGGELDGARILGRKTVELMRQNHLPGGADLGSLALGAFGETQFPGVGFGLGFAVSLGGAPTGVIGSTGEFYWGGAASTIFWIDPVEDLIAIFMTQLMPSGTYNFRGQLHSLIYPAIVD